MMAGRDVNYGVGDVGSVQSMLPAELGWIAVDPGTGMTADVVGWAVVVVERSGWVTRSVVAAVGVDRGTGLLGTLDGWHLTKAGG